MNTFKTRFKKETIRIASVLLVVVSFPSFGPPIGISVGGGIYSQTTAIPDPNFEQALIDLGIDSDGIINGQVLTSDIENVIGLIIFNKGISDLTGIEGFTALEELNVGGNQLSSVNLTNNLNLKHLNVGGNQLSNIDLSNNINLDFLIIAVNPLQNIDLSANTALTHLNANGAHSFSILDLSNNLQ